MIQILFFWFDRLLVALAVLAAGLIATITLAITVNLILRNLKLPVIYGTLDAVEYAIMLTTFLAAPWVLHRRAHVVVDLMSSALNGSAQRALGRLVAFIGAVICFGFAWFGMDAMLASMARGSMIRTSFIIPEWWTLSVVPISMALCAIEFFRQGIQPNTNDRPLKGL